MHWASLVPLFEFQLLKYLKVRASCLLQNLSHDCQLLCHPSERTLKLLLTHNNTSLSQQSKYQANKYTLC